MSQMGAAPKLPALGDKSRWLWNLAIPSLGVAPHPDIHSTHVTFETALSCLLAWCTRSRMAFTALGVSKSLASAAFTAFLVMLSLE